MTCEPRLTHRTLDILENPLPKRRGGHRANKQAAITPVTAAGQVTTANVTKAGTGTAVTRAERVIWKGCESTADMHY